MRLLQITLFVLAMFSLGGIMYAQEEASIDSCTQEDYAQLQTDITELAGLFANIEANVPNETVLQIRQRLDTFQLACIGVFSNETHSSGIIGPIKFDGTLYELTLTIPEGDFEYGTVQFTEIAGDCGFNLLVSSPLGGGSETDLFEIGDDCEMLFEVDSSSGWTLSLVKLR